MLGGTRVGTVDSFIPGSHEITSAVFRSRFRHESPIVLALPCGMPAQQLTRARAAAYTVVTFDFLESIIDTTVWHPGARGSRDGAAFRLEISSGGPSCSMLTSARHCW